VEAAQRGDNARREVRLSVPRNAGPPHSETPARYTDIAPWRCEIVAVLEVDHTESGKTNQPPRSDMHPALIHQMVQTQIDELYRASVVSAHRAEARRAGARTAPQPQALRLPRPAMMRRLVARLAH
jgi:hypothetical protein